MSSFCHSGLIRIRRPGVRVLGHILALPNKASATRASFSALARVCHPKAGRILLSFITGLHHQVTSTGARPFASIFQLFAAFAAIPRLSRPEALPNPHRSVHGPALCCFYRFLPLCPTFLSVLAKPLPNPRSGRHPRALSLRFAAPLLMKKPFCGWGIGCTAMPRNHLKS